MKKKSLILFVALASLSASIVSCTSGGGKSQVSGDYYSLTFNFSDGNSRPYKKDVEKGQSLESVPSPKREGYQFDGWYTSEEGGDKLTFPYTATDNIAFYAHWKAAEFSVTFNLNYENAPESSVVKVEYNKNVEAPSENPTREGYTFRYWTSDTEGKEQVTFPYNIKKDMTFYASWRENSVSVYNVTINYGDYTGAPEAKVIEVEDGSQVTRNDVGTPTRNGYDFKGWSLSEDGEVITLPYSPNGDATLYAVWAEKEYTLNFKYNYPGSPNKDVYSTSSFTYSTAIEAPETDPTRTNYSFAGWYTSEIGGEKVTFDDLHLARNTTYYAHWIHDAVVTDTFHAEYCEFAPDQEYWGYSGSTYGASCIVLVDGQAGAVVDNYEENSAISAGHAFAVSYQYSRDSVLEFKIEASEDINGATLKANWGSEFDLTFAPTGENAYIVEVNGVSINYAPVLVTAGGFASSGAFVMHTLGSINLKKGTNVIKMYPDNDHPVGGTMQSAAPVTDCIKIEGANGKISWKPIYDNINNKAQVKLWVLINLLRKKVVLFGLA